MRNPKKEDHENPRKLRSKTMVFSRIRKLKRLSKLRRNVIPKIICNENTKRNNIIDIQALMKKNKPFFLRLSTSEETPYPFFRSTNQNELVQEISHLLSKKFPEKIDINSSKTGIFSGDYHKQETISLDFPEFLSYEGDSTLYLAQIPLYNRMKPSDFYNPKSEKGKGIQSDLQQINNNQKTSLNFKIPHPLHTLLRNQQLESINLWLSRQPTISNWHYDSYDNFLCMVSGTKEIRLLSPKDGGEFLNRKSILEPYYNQATEKKGKKRIKQEFRCQIHANDVLFIPQGWYHHVTSYGDNLMMGLSFWFNSIEEETFFKGREDYYLRYLLLQKCQSEMKQKIMNSMKKSQLLKLKDLQPDEVREFLHRIGETPENLRKFLMNLNELEVEFFTNLLEDIDKKIPLNKRVLKLLKNGKVGKVNGEISQKIDNFYKDFWGEIEYSLFLDRFLEMKKKNKKNILYEIFENL